MSKYTELITNYHASKPKFKQHVDLSTQPFNDLINHLNLLIEQFDVYQACGQQLDIAGQWVGLSRQVKKPIQGIYFALDDEQLGFDQGSWKGRFDPISGLTALSDETYRVALLTRIAINHWDGTGGKLPLLLDAALASSGLTIQVIDKQDMSIDVLVFTNKGQIPSELREAISRNYLTVKAAGVHVDYIFSPSQGGEIFGFDVNNQWIKGLDQAAWGAML